ncbi:restriction endonuclease [Novipirellula sp. SH528]|uniref:nSTAND3 domain-containing NTPase n=1 Tax=Novipirellula sp. SH528 TaxID=3454466 RepID=UPI003F9ED249
MPAYDFSTLSPLDFEELSRDLLQKELGLHLESFRSGRDRGVDLRYSKPRDGTVLIVQAKHWAKSGFAKLKSYMKHEELPKARKLKPSRYILTTSVSFAKGEKDELFKVLSPLIQSPGDIFGAEDLNNLLGKYQGIERQHFKLWLPSVAVLQKLLSNGVFAQSALEMDEIERHLSMFVHTPAFDRAIDMLSETGVCMLTGIPGIGKTTTARLLVAYHLENDFDGVYVAGGTSNAFDVYSPEIKQIFFYDDFLGATSLRERLPKNEDSQLLQLMKACRKNPASKRLVLTTREYLFEQAIQQHEILARDAGVEAAKSTVELEDYTAKIRAKILVNHLHFYGIEPDVCSEFVSSGLARKTLDHENYNPRIVETMCEMQSVSAFNGDGFGKAFLARLDDPKSIWEHAFRHQLTENAQKLLLVFAMHGSNVSVQGLKSHYLMFREALGLELSGYDAAFSATLKELEGNFLAVLRRKDVPYLVFHNPAIEDFTSAELANDNHLLKTALNCFSFQDVLIWISKKLVADHRGFISSDEIVAAMERADRTTRFCVSDSKNGSVLMSTSSAEDALADWIGVLRRFRSLAALDPVFEIARKHLSDSDLSRSDVSEVCRLYKTYFEAAKPYRSHQLLPVTGVRERLIEHCYFPEDFGAVIELFDENEEEEKEKLRDHFASTCIGSVNSIVNQASTSDQAIDAIHELESVAVKLGFDTNDLGLDDLHEHVDMLSEQEDRQAEIHEEDWKFSRLDKSKESRAVDDILDSLRE